MTAKRSTTLREASGLEASLKRAESQFETRTIRQRKDEHLDIVLKRDVGSGTTTTGFEHVRFAHVALPEMALADVDLTTRFLGRQVNAPILISSMTGGPARAAAINESIARAAQAVGIGFGVGSQRIALETEHCGGIDHRLRRLAPDVPIMANFGAAQLQLWDGPEMARRAVGMIEADALIIHLNPLQEAVQERGDRDWRGLLAAIEGVCRKVDFPVIVKEVGSGISGRLARRLFEAGVAGRAGQDGSRPSHRQCVPQLGPAHRRGAARCPRRVPRCGGDCVRRAAGRRRLRQSHPAGR
jgi:isopentenyl-diphosphate Delta-isomerase